MRHQAESPGTFDEPDQGMVGANDGVVGMLEATESDFAALS